MGGARLTSGSEISLGERERERTPKDSMFLPEGLNEALGDVEQDGTEFPLMCWSGLPSTPREIEKAAPLPPWGLHIPWTHAV